MMRQIIEKKRKIKTGLGDKIFNVVNFLIMAFIVVIVIYPVLNVIAISFSDAYHVGRADITFYPKGFNVTSYSYILKDKEVWIGYRNSIFYAVVTAFVSLLFTSMFAYPLAVQGFVAKKFMTVYLTIVMFFGGGMIPTYMLIRNLQLIDNPLAIILPGCVYAYNVFMFRTFFQNIPSELLESAQIDGANDFRILFSIVIPLSKALLATFGLFSIVGTWNSWFQAMIYFKNHNLWPVQLVLREYLYSLTATSMQSRAGMGGASLNPNLLQQIAPKGVQMSMVVVTMFPIMLIYPFFQKYFVKGMLVGSIKG